MPMTTERLRYLLKLKRLQMAGNGPRKTFEAQQTCVGDFGAAHNGLGITDERTISLEAGDPQPEPVDCIISRVRTDTGFVIQRAIRPPVRARDRDRVIAGVRYEYNPKIDCWERVP